MSRYINKGSLLNCGPCNSSADYCKDTTRFFSNLADKLKKMAIAINDRIDDLKNQSCQTIPGAIVFATVEMPKMTVGIKYEYVEYIKRYGPPDDGKFDPIKLDLLRKELNISTDTYTI
jgi:hypothetical protein